MIHSIKSRKLERELTFTLEGHHIWVNLNGQSGRNGCQLCDFGGLSGGTLSVKPNITPAQFAKVCRGWLRAYYRRAF